MCFRVGRQCSHLKGLAGFYPYHNSLQSEHVPYILHYPQQFQGP
jgi:hypothetical protein